MSKFDTKKFLFLFCFVMVFLIFSLPVHGLSISELKDLIDKKRIEKERLEEENKKLEAQIEETNKAAQSLSNAVKVLDTTQKKLQNDIKVTQNNISSTELTIQKLGVEIIDKKSQIENNVSAIAESIRALEREESSSLIEVFLNNETLSSLWDKIETLRQFENSISNKTSELLALKGELENKKSDNETQKSKLVGLKSELSDREVIVKENKKSKTVLLTETQSKEAEYRAQLQRNIELGKQFEDELFQYESELKVKIDPSQLPSEGNVLNWPLEKITLTQRFGATVDAKRLYVSGTHNGVDFRASVGTTVMSVFRGIVKGIGNTDDQPGCYSYGRWVLIEHPNGLSSLYAHLSSIKVSPGQTVSTGDLIGYSGGQPGTSGAGFSTGPHLHLTIYASQAVNIKKYDNSKFCKNVSIPIAPANGYLDPLEYLPKL